MDPRLRGGSPPTGGLSNRDIPGWREPPARAYRQAFYPPGEVGGGDRVRTAKTASFIKLRDSLGTTTRLHDLRHFAATQVLAAGLPVTTVAGRLGHTDATTTLSIYAHFVEASDREAAQTIAHVLAKPRVVQEARASEGDVI